MQLDGPPITVQVVEGDDLMQRLLCNVLQRAGYRTVVSADGVTALGVARRERPRVLLAEVFLPGGNGIQLIERMHAISDLSTTAAILMSSVDAEVYELRAAALGAGYLEKPVSPAALLSAVESALTGSNALAPVLGMTAV